MRITLPAVVVLLALACGSAARPAAVATPLETAVPDRVDLLVGGVPRPLKDGDGIPLGGDLIARVALRPLAGVSNARLLDLELWRSAGPLTDADILVAARMRYMDHGSFQVATIPSGGHYVAPLVFAMPGEWDLDLTVRAAGTDASFALALEILR